MELIPMTHEEYEQLLSRVDSENLPDDVIQNMEKHSESCPVCKMQAVEDEVFLLNSRRPMVEALIVLIAEDGCESLGIPSKKEDYKFFYDMMREAH
jgi:hypothetical protein